MNIFDRLGETRANIAFAREYTLELQEQGRRLMKTGKTISRICEVCGSPQQEDRFMAPVYDFVACRNCGFVYAKSILGEEAMDKFYRHDEVAQRSWSKQLERLEANPNTTQYPGLVTRIMKNVRGRERALDFGCGQGEFLYELKGHFRKVIGVELGKEQAETARRKFGVEVLEGDIGSLGLQKESFDLICMNQVIEHLPRVNDVLKKLVQLLKPEGVLAITCPNLDSWSMRIFREKHSHVNTQVHVNMFSPKTIEKLALRHGLKKRQVGTYMLDTTLIDLAYLIFAKKSFMHRCNFNILLYPPSWLLEKAVNKANEISNNVLMGSSGSYIEAIFMK
ncbi:MAG: class I SAM-dependent methyltransferase [Candidatus ainarchaeum sp.]|nr:class I SAM-dependent methyltransferase [Candidatus ainarchaeum sp.]